MKRFLIASFAILSASLGIMSVSTVVSSGDNTSANQQRFLAKGDGTVIDQTNDLVWQAADDSQPRSWADAAAYCRNLTLNNKSSWRLPTKEELNSIVDQERKPAIDTKYFKINGLRYWTSTVYDDNPSLKCFIFFPTGATACADKINTFLARCVRNAHESEHVSDGESDYAKWTTSSKLKSIVRDMEDNRMFPSTVEGREVEGRDNSGKVYQYRAKFIPFLPDMLSFKSQWGIVDRWYKHYSGQYIEEGYTEYSHTTFVDKFGFTLHQATWVLIYREREQKQNEFSNSKPNL